MLGPLSYVDVALLAICFVSGILAMYRGLTREMLSIVSWIVAGLAGGYIYLYQKRLGEEVSQQLGIGQPLVALIGLAALVFLITLIVVHLVTSRVSDTILDSRVGMIDRILGFGFGAVRGFLLVLIPFMFYQHFVPDRAKQYPFVAQSKSYDMLIRSGNAIRPTLEQFGQRIQSKSGDTQG
jgi:membrane protein required for colicin V production